MLLQARQAIYLFQNTLTSIKSQPPIIAPSTCNTLIFCIHIDYKVIRSTALALQDRATFSQIISLLINQIVSDYSAFQPRPAPYTYLKTIKNGLQTIFLVITYNNNNSDSDSSSELIQPIEEYRYVTIETSS